MEKSIRYTVAIELGGDTTAFEVVVPDLPGCFSAGDTLAEAIIGAQEAAAILIDAMLEAGGVILAPGGLESMRHEPAYDGWSFGVIALDPALLERARPGPGSPHG